MLPDQVSNPGPLTYESGALPIALRRLAETVQIMDHNVLMQIYLKSALVLTYILSFTVLGPVVGEAILTNTQNV